MHSSAIPVDAEPGDIVVGNQGAAAEVQASCGAMWLMYIGNYHEGVVRRPSARVYRFDEAPASA